MKTTIADVFLLERKARKESQVSDKQKSLEYIRFRKEQYWGEFTTHGLTKINESDGIERFIWVICLISALVCVVTLLYQQISNYLQYETVTSFQIITTEKNMFPQIVICDKNLLHEHFEGFQDKEDDFSLGKNNTIWKRWMCQDRGSPDCSKSEYLDVFHGGGCLTWNHRGKYIDVDNLVNTEFHVKYNESHTEPPNVVVYVNEPLTEFLDMADAIPLNHGQETYISVEKTVYKRLEAPYTSNCKHENKNQLFIGNYSRTACMNSVYLLYLFKLCGSLPAALSKLLPKDIYDRYKQTKNTTQALECMMKNSKGSIDYSQCGLGCVENKYRLSSNEHRREIIDVQNKTYIFRVQFTLGTSNSYRMYEETPKYKWDEVVAYIGGIMGLLIGASAFSIVELIYFGILLVKEKLLLRKIKKLQACTPRQEASLNGTTPRQEASLNEN